MGQRLNPFLTPS